MKATKTQPPRLRRAYFDCRYGQLHVHNAIPAGGGFDELTTLVCIHGKGQSGRAFGPVLAALGADRSIYAPDLPGCGESDPSAGVAAVEAGADAVADFLDSMRIRRVDLLALGEGAAIARRLAAQRSAQVRKLALVDEQAPAAPPAATAQPLLEATGDLAAAVRQLATFFA